MWRGNKNNIYYENDFVTYNIYPSVLEIHFKKKVILDFAAAKKIVDDRIRIQEGRPYLVLCHIDGVHSSDKPARDYLSNYGSHYLKAVAFISKLDLARNLLDNYLMNLNSNVPWEVFPTRQQGMDYLFSVYHKKL